MNTATFVDQFKKAIGNRVTIDETCASDTCLPFCIPFTIVVCGDDPNKTDEQLMRKASMVVATVTSVSAICSARVVKITAYSDDTSNEVKFEVFVRAMPKN